MDNIYDVTFRKPALHSVEMYKELEALAQQLVQSGRLRIEADERMNFIRFSRPHENIYLVFSHRELFHPLHTDRTLKIITRSLQYQHRQGAHKKAKEEFERLKKEILRFTPVSEEIEIKLARLVVQAAHPSVIKLMLVERIPVFVSFSHMVGDMLDMQSWQSVGTSSGLQSTDGMKAEVFISLGGDPFAEEKPDMHPMDGKAAIARLLVIGGQEIGHYSDIRRDAKGNQISRYASDLGATRAHPHVREARLYDIERVEKIRKLFYHIGLGELLTLENALKFYLTQKRELKGSMIYLRLWWHKRWFFFRASQKKLGFIFTFPKTPYPAHQIEKMLGDMAANLTPQADVYKFEDKVKEEAIACVEALARVPQQVNKWGHKGTSVMMAGLYQVYYKEVIPGCIAAYEAISGEKYRMRLTRALWWKRAWFRLWH
jgi:hypothetical protein